MEHGSVVTASYPPPSASAKGDTRVALDVAAFIDERPISAYQKRLIALVGCCVLMDGFDAQVIGFVAPSLAEHWHIEASALAPLFAAGLIGMLIGAAVLGMLSDRIGRRPVLIGATFFFALGTLATAATSTLPQMMALRFLTGLGIGGVMGNAAALVSEYSPRHRRASPLMWVSCGFTGGAILGGLIAAAVIPLAGWRWVFVIGGVLPLLIGSVMIAKLPESLTFLISRDTSSATVRQALRRIDKMAKIDENAGFVRPAAAPESGLFFALFGNGLAPITFLLWAVSFLNLLALYFLASWLPLLATKMAYSGGIGIMMGTLLQVGGLIGALLLGPIMDRFGFTSILVRILLAGGIAIALVGQFIVPDLLRFALVFVAGVAVVGGQPALNALAASLYPSAIRATGVGWCLAVGRAGSICGPLVAGAMLASGSAVQTLFLAVAVAPIASAVLIIGLARVIARGAAASGAVSRDPEGVYP